MIKQLLTVGLTILVVAIGAGVFIHALVTTRQDSALQETTLARPSDPATRMQPPKAPLRPEDLPLEIVEAVKTALPDASIEAVQGGKGKYRLKLAWGGKRGSAKLKMSGNQVTGSVGEDLPVSDMPPALVEAFKDFVPEGKIESFSKITLVGGNRDGQAVYRWDWGNNCDGEASLDGKQITMTDEIPSGQLPPVVTDAVAQAFPQASIDKKAQRVIEDGRISYKFDVQPAGGGKKVKVTASATGELSWK